MQRCEDNVAARLNGNALQPLSDVSVTVTDDRTGLKATLYSDDGVTQIKQPLITDDNGYYGFYAANGEYTLSFSGLRIATFTRKIVLADPSDNPYASKAELAAGSGASLVMFTQAGTGAVPRPLQDELRERVSVKQFGAAGDSSANDTASIPLADVTLGKVGEYKVTAFDAKYGNPITGHGVAHNQTTGRVYNPIAHRSMQTFGAEVLQHWFSLFLHNSDTVSPGDSAIKKIVLSGDSVTFGYNDNAWGVPANILTFLAVKRGYKNVSVVNRGQSGKSCHEWLNDGYLAGDLAANPDLLVLGWGDNDFGQGRTVEQLLDDYRAALTIIRAAKTPAQMSIILRTPTSMNDIEFGRTQVKLEQIVEAYKQLARDFQCGFVDAYSLFQNSHDGAGVWFDLDHGRSIHPGDVLQEHICAAIAELCLPDHGTDWQNNRVHNYSGAIAANKRILADPPSSYFDGISFNRFAEGAGNGLGNPYDGWATTIKQADSATLQIIAPIAGATVGRGLSFRHGFNNTWGSIIGGKFSGADLLMSGWTNGPGGAAGLVYWVGIDGAVYLAGTIGAGTKADGAVLFSLPAQFRPTFNQVCLCATETGFARLAVNTNGDVVLYGGSGAGSYLTLNGVYFY